jgi:phospholipid/cholesterol/gamma-HCH transport system permease protein
LIEQLAAPARAVGGFVEMSLDTFVKIFRRPFQFREFLDQTWMIARVSLIPTLLVAIPFTVLVAFTLNILLREIGAADLSGAGTAFGTITQLGPVVTVLVVAGAGATAICADLGARTIREEIDECGCWASTRSSALWCRACWRRRSSHCSSTAWSA